MQEYSATTAHMQKKSLANYVSARLFLAEKEGFEENVSSKKPDSTPFQTICADNRADI